MKVVITFTIFIGTSFLLICCYAPVGFLIRRLWWLYIWIAMPCVCFAVVVVPVNMFMWNTTCETQVTICSMLCSSELQKLRSLSPCVCVCVCVFVQKPKYVTIADFTFGSATSAHYTVCCRMLSIYQPRGWLYSFSLTIIHSTETLCLIVYLH